MRIERLSPFLVGRCLLVRVYTDAGIVGTGEAGLWAHHRLVYEAIRDLSEYYVGKDPRRIEHHHQTISKATHFEGTVLSAALSAIDVALWDILARSVDLPIHQLLGGRCRDKVQVFVNVTGNTCEERAASAFQSVERGFTSLRTTPFLPGWSQRNATVVIGEAVEIVAAIRQAVGYGIDLGLEIHRNLGMDAAIILAGELAPFRILYYEDPLPPQSIEVMEQLARHIDIPMATGERLHSLHQFKALLNTQAVALIRPDLSLAGGYTQVTKIAALAEASMVGIFPHLMGSPVNTAAYIQLDVAIPNYWLQEENRVQDHPLNEIIDQPLTLEAGHVLVPDRPGIGVEIIEEKLARFPYEPRPIAGRLRADGSVAN
jgi:galactonate dehydratase